MRALRTLCPQMPPPPRPRESVASAPEAIAASTFEFRGSSTIEEFLTCFLHAPKGPQPVSPRF